MQNTLFSITLEKNPEIYMKVMPGHFIAGNAHVSHYLDLGSMKSNARIARDVARELAIPYLSSNLVDTIVCMENTKVIGAFLAQELMEEGHGVVNSGGEIHVVTPMSNVNGNLVFYDSELEWITGKSVVLLVSMISSGRTVGVALECLEYYGGKLAGISALFSATQGDTDREVNTLFTASDIPGYALSLPDECEMCRSGGALDAIVSSEGYIKLK